VLLFLLPPTPVHARVCSDSDSDSVKEAAFRFRFSSVRVHTECRGLPGAGAVRSRALTTQVIKLKELRIFLRHIPAVRTDIHYLWAFLGSFPRILNRYLDVALRLFASETKSSVYIFWIGTRSVKNMKSCKTGPNSGCALFWGNVT